MIKVSLVTITLLFSSLSYADSSHPNLDEFVHVNQQIGQTQAQIKMLELKIRELGQSESDLINKRESLHKQISGLTFTPSLVRELAKLSKMQGFMNEAQVTSYCNTEGCLKDTQINEIAEKAKQALALNIKNSSKTGCHDENGDKVAPFTPNKNEICAANGSWVTRSSQ